MEGDWIIEEEKEIEKESRKKGKNEFAFDLKLFILILLIGLLFYASADGTEINCPHCKKSLEIRGIWGETWACSNPHCGYENYDGINYCAICGKYRYE